MAMKPLFIIKTGETMPGLRERRGDFEDWIISGFGGGIGRIEVIAPFRGDPLPLPEDASGVVITGSHAMVTQPEAWSERTAAWIPLVVASAIPLLGICYGHQLLAHALGGRVGACAVGIEMGTVEIEFLPQAANDPLFQHLTGRIAAHASHSESVLQLPPAAVPLASNPNERHHAFAIGRAAWGIQFHPEFDAGIMQAYLDEFSDLIRASGQHIDALKAGLRETPRSRSVLKRFAGIVSERASRKAS